MLAPHLMARVRDSSHFLAVSVDETNHAASAREWNIAVQLEPANGARWHDAVQNRCVTVPIQQRQPLTDSGSSLSFLIETYSTPRFSSLGWTKAATMRADGGRSSSLAAGLRSL